MSLRYELKYRLDAQSAEVIKKRVAGVLKPDQNTGGRYFVHNIYFDDMYYSAYHAKQSGAYRRDKYRIRYYNGDLSYIRLEHKHKTGALSQKKSVILSKEEYDLLSAGELPFLFSEKKPLGPAFSQLFNMKRMRPVVSFKYYREAYVHPAGNVRITFDSKFPGEYGIMELKYSNYMPCFISDLLSLPLAHVETSKYGLALEKKGGPHWT